MSLAADTDNGVFSVVIKSTTQVLCGDLLLILTSTFDTVLVLLSIVDSDVTIYC
jgi:hypothetical protein